MLNVDEHCNPLVSSQNRGTTLNSLGVTNSIAVCFSCHCATPADAQVSNLSQIKLSLIKMITFAKLEKVINHHFPQLGILVRNCRLRHRLEQLSCQGSTLDCCGSSFDSWLRLIFHSRWVYCVIVCMSVYYLHVHLIRFKQHYRSEFQHASITHHVVNYRIYISPALMYAQRQNFPSNCI